MKKILTAVCGMALVLGTSCSKKADDNHTPEQIAFGDTVSIAFGKFAGLQEYEQLQRQMLQMNDEQRKAYDKERFMKGLELVLSTDTADIAFLNGIYAGLNLYQPATQLDKMTGVPMNNKELIKAFRSVYTADSVSPQQVDFIRENFRAVSDSINKLVQKKQEEDRMNSPESKKNIADGEKYIKERLAEGYKKSASGLVYKINNPGTGKVEATDNVKLRYVGKHTNGQVFDESGSDPITANVGNFVPGFKEGLTLVGKGGSATLVIPADLAYGVNGAGSKIGPNEVLVFEISIDDIIPANVQ